MIIDSIKITNFGLYKGENLIQLQPDSLSNRNIVVVSGQNGVGKSTLQEAIHLCLLGSLSIDNRLSEINYEKYLCKRAYNNGGSNSESLRTSLEITIQFLKSGSFVNYRIQRSWYNDLKNVDEEIFIEEDGKLLSELNKKEKNLFLRELIQPGLAKVMFFDGEKLLSLYDETNLTEFIGESCKYLFGLNFIDLLNTDLSYYINKLYSQQDKTQHLKDILALKDALISSNGEIIELQEQRRMLSDLQSQLKAQISVVEKQISNQGRWVVEKLDNFKSERQTLEASIVQVKKELVEIYSSLGPFVFCRALASRLRERLVAEKEIEKWHHARDLIKSKINDLETLFRTGKIEKDFSIDSNKANQLLELISSSLTSSGNLALEQEVIHHGVLESQRIQLISWIEQILENLSALLLGKSELMAGYEERLKALGKEQSSFSKEDAIELTLREIQNLNKQIGANEQKVSVVLKRIEETSKKREQELQKLKILEEKLQEDKGIDTKLKLSSKTKMVLESYAGQLLERKLILLSSKVLEKFNLLCRKDSYLDELVIDRNAFTITLLRKDSVVEHGHLSAGEKQLLIISFLWGLRDLTNIALPLIIDTPLARLDLEHRKAFIEGFLPEIRPQVILIGTDMELTGDVLMSMEHNIAHQYQLSYDGVSHSTKINEIDRIYKEKILDEI